MINRRLANGDAASRLRLVLAAILLGAATLLAYSGIPTPVAFGVLAAGALILWTLPVEVNIAGYLLTLAFQVFQSLVVFRVAVADFFMVPAAIRTYLSSSRSSERLPESTLWRPFVLLVVVFAIGNAIGWLEMGSLSSYALFNKDLGILYLLAGYYTLVCYLKSRDLVLRTVRWFVFGVAAANLTALIGAALAFAGLQNDLYLVGNLRLYGWMLNPSLFGGILLTAAMIELALLTSIPSGTSSALRWVNLWLMAAGVTLTVSRGIWVAGAVAASVLLAIHVITMPRRLPAMRLAAIGVWILLPFVAVANIVRLNSGSLSIESPQAHAEELQQRLVAQCSSQPQLEVCGSVQMPDATSGSAALPDATETSASQEPASSPPVSVPTSTASQQQPDATVPPTRSPSTASSAAPYRATDNAMTNVRGLQDRAAIIGVAGRQYLASLRRILFGIGLGTFFATSPDDFGVPLIIHNTFLWFLFEMGPLGLVTVLWIWAVTMRNLWRVCRSPDSAALGVGLSAAFAGLTVFCILNEGFYQRHLWLVFALADRMSVLQAEGESRQVPAAAETVSLA